MNALVFSGTFLEVKMLLQLDTCHGNKWVWWVWLKHVGSASELLGGTV